MNIFQFAEFYNLQLMNVNVDTQVAKAVFINLTLNVIYYEIQHLLTLKEGGGGECTTIMHKCQFIYMYFIKQL